MKISKVSIGPQPNVAAPAEGAEKAPPTAGAPTTATAKADTFSRPSAAELDATAKLAGLVGGGRALPDLPDADVRQENVRAAGALFASAALQEAKLFSAADRVAQLFGAGMLPVASGHTTLDATLDSFAAATAENPEAAQALEAAAESVKSNPEQYLAADGSVLPAALASLMQEKLGAAEGKGPAAGQAVLGAMNGQDIEAIAMLVLMQAAKSAQEDLKAIMDQVKSINQAKGEQRGALNELQARAAETPRASGPPWDLGAASAAGAKADGAEDSRGSIGELSEVQQTKLQALMKRRAQTSGMLSNFLAKVSSVSSQIVSNLK